MKKQVSNVFLLTGILFLLSVSFSASASSVSLWNRDNITYLCAESSMPVWVEVPSDAMSMGQGLTMTIEMPIGFEITGYGESTQFAMQPKPLYIPFSVTKIQDYPKSVYQAAFNAPIFSDGLRAAFLVRPSGIEPGDYEMKIGLKTSSSSYVWSDKNITAKVLGELNGLRPRRLQMSVFDYADYTNADFKNNIAQTICDAGFNWIHNMNYYSQTNTVAQMLKPEGVKAGWIWWWEKNNYALLKDHPEAARIDWTGYPVPGSVCYAWCIANRELTKDLLVTYIDERNTPIKYECIFLDNEEKAINDSGTIQGDFYTPITLETFRSFAGIDAGVELTQASISANYADEWVEYRCWECAQMAEILGEAIKEYDPNMQFGVYSGYKYTGSYTGFSKRAYSMDWDLMGQNPYLDFGCAGYYGTSYIANTANAIYPKVMMPGEMYLNNFITDPVMLEPNEFAFRLVQDILYGGGKGGVAVWYAQVLDAAAYSAVSRVAKAMLKVEDFLLDGVRCDGELITMNIYSGYVYAYKLGADRRAILVINPEYSSKSISLNWNVSLPDTAQSYDIESGEFFDEAGTITDTIAARSFKIYITQEPNPVYCGDVGTVYLRGDINKDCRVDYDDLAILAEDWLGY